MLFLAVLRVLGWWIDVGAHSRVSRAHLRASELKVDAPSLAGVAEASLASADLVLSTGWRTTRRPRRFGERGRPVVRGLSGGRNEDAVDGVDDAVGRSDVWLDDAGVVDFHGAARHL